ncbi:MAG: phage tail protein [Pyrinomonadaceae bacterium]
MADSYIGEIRMFGGNFAPRSWAQCDGQIMAISQNTALFSLLGTNYGGDGKTNFALPNLKSRAAMSFGSGPGLTSRSLGETGGETAVTLTGGQSPPHKHLMQCNDTAGDSTNPQDATFGVVGGRGRPPFYANEAPPPQNTIVPMAQQAIGSTGGNQAHNNQQPYQAVNFIICLQGAYPPRS